MTQKIMVHNKEILVPLHRNKMICQKTDLASEEASAICAFMQTSEGGGWSCGTYYSIPHHSQQWYVV